MTSQTVSPILFDQKPLLLRKTPEKDTKYVIECHQDFLCVTKTETFAPKAPRLPRWQTIRELLFAEDLTAEEEATQVSEDRTYDEIQVLEDVERAPEDRLKDQPSEESLDTSSSAVSVPSLASMETLLDYLRWINVLKVLFIVFCVNGFLLQSLLLFRSEPDFRSSASASMSSPFVAIAVCFATQVSVNSSAKDVFLRAPKTECLVDENESAISCEANAKSLLENRFLCLHFRFLNEIQFFADFWPTLRLVVHSPLETPDESSSQLQLALNASTGLELRVFALPTRLSADEECEERPARQRCLRRCLSRALRDFCGECFPEGIHLWDEEFAENAVFCPKSRCLLNSSLQKCRQNCPKVCKNTQKLQNF
jgi:hypothetical protein